MRLQQQDGHHEFIWLVFGERTFAVDPFCIDIGVRGLV